MKRIGVMGSVNLDWIRNADGEEHRGLGGVLYTAVALTHLAPHNDVFLMGRVGADVVAAVRELVDHLPALRLEGMVPVAPANYQCTLVYAADGSKVEWLKGQLGPLSWDEVTRTPEPLDALLVNFITGYEIELDVLQRLRPRIAGPVIIDLHSLFLNTAGNGTRSFHRPPRWAEWVSAADVVQMNEAEAAVLGELSEPTEAALSSLAVSLLELGPQLVVITRGTAGALAAAADGTRCTLHATAACGAGEAVDTTGCGDVFLAALGLGVTRGDPPQRLLHSACRAAGLASRVRGPEALQVLSQLRPV